MKSIPMLSLLLLIGSAQAESGLYQCELKAKVRPTFLSCISYNVKLVVETATLEACTEIATDLFRYPYQTRDRYTRERVFVYYMTSWPLSNCIDGTSVERTKARKVKYKFTDRSMTTSGVIKRDES